MSELFTVQNIVRETVLLETTRDEDDIISGRPILRVQRRQNGLTIETGDGSAFVEWRYLGNLLGMIGEAAAEMMDEPDADREAAEALARVLEG